MTKITITPITELVKIRMADRCIAASLTAQSLAEGDMPPVTYLPLANALEGVHVPTDHQSHCPHKGVARYFSVAGQENKAWIYFDPKPKVADIAGCIAYYADAVEEERVPLPDIDERAAEILTFWFDETPEEKHFKADPDFDALIAERFGQRYRAAAEGQHDDWARHPYGALALILLLDQFSRNMFRDTPQAFATDMKALDIARMEIRMGHDLALSPRERAFAYMPFMHSENMMDQNVSVALFTQRLPRSSNLKFALTHRDDIHRHGRFPGRDMALGRG